MREDPHVVGLVKLVVFVPEEAEEVVRLAMGRAGAGRIGRYDHCAFVTAGTGYFRPLDGSEPYRGEIGRLERVAECRIEMVCSEELLAAVLQALRAAHPYEEIAYDVIPLLNHRHPISNRKA